MLCLTYPHRNSSFRLYLSLSLRSFNAKKMILTEQVFEQAKSERGGWNYKQVQLLGEKTFLNKGWKKRCLGKEFPDEVIAQFIALKDAHFTTTKPFKPKTKSGVNNAKRAARQRVFSYVVHTLNHRRNGLKLAAAIKIFAKHQNLTIKGQPKEWLYKLYLSGNNPIISRAYVPPQNEPPLDRLARNLKKRNVSYPVFLNSKYWHEVRKLVFIRDGKICRVCKSESNLEVHHDHYRNHFNEHNHLEDLMVLCRTCHQDYHDNIEKKV